jgi:hypothetical protein
MRIFTLLREQWASLQKFYNFYKRNPTFISRLQKFEIIFKFSETLKWVQVWSNCRRSNVRRRIYFANHSRPCNPKATYLLSEYLTTILAVTSHFCFRPTIILTCFRVHTRTHISVQKKRCKWNNAPCKIIMLRNRKDNITTVTSIR